MILERVAEESEKLGITTERLGKAETIDEIARVLRDDGRGAIGADGIALILRDGDLCHYFEEDAIGPLSRTSLQGGVADTIERLGDAVDAKHFSVDADVAVSRQLVALGDATSSELSPTSDTFSAATETAVDQLQAALGPRLDRDGL